MDSGPSFSVIIPVFNGAKTIGNAIESVINQTHNAVEIIVVNDGSTDDTDEAVKPFLNKIKYIKQQNSGVSAARNNGAKAASSDWLAFLDCDDWFYENRLELHASIIHQDPSLAAIFSGYNYTSLEKGTKISSIESSSIGGYFFKKIQDRKFISLNCADSNIFIQDQYSDVRALSVKKELFLSVNGFPIEFTICEDVLFIIKLLRSGKSVAISKDICAAYNIHESGLIRSDTFRAQKETVNALLSIKSDIENGLCNLKSGWQHLTKKAYLNLAYHYAKSGKKHEAAKTILSSFLFQPALKDVKDILSVIKG